MIDKNFIGMTSGEKGTWYEVIGQNNDRTFSNYPAIVDGKEKPYYEFPRIEDYLKAKVKVDHKAVELIVTGNAVCCESDLQNQGYKAAATGPNTVYVYE